MNLEQRMNNLEQDMRLLVDKLTCMAAFENMVIENLDKFEEMNNRIQREYFRLLDLIQDQVNNNNYVKIEMQRLVEECLHESRPKRFRKYIIKKIKSIFNIKNYD